MPGKVNPLSVANSQEVPGTLFLFPLARECDFEIGFDWLCFFAAPVRQNLYKPFLALALRSFSPPANWLCFFKSYPFKCAPGPFIWRPFVLFRISDPRFHGDEFTPAKAEVLRISGQRPAFGFVFSNSPLSPTEGGSLKRSTRFREHKLGDGFWQASCFRPKAGILALFSTESSQIHRTFCVFLPYFVVSSPLFGVLSRVFADLQGLPMAQVCGLQ